MPPSMVVVIVSGLDTLIFGIRVGISVFFVSRFTVTVLIVTHDEDRGCGEVVESSGR